MGGGQYGVTGSASIKAGGKLEGLGGKLGCLGGESSPPPPLDRTLGEHTCLHVGACGVTVEGTHAVQWAQA